MKTVKRIILCLLSFLLLMCGSITAFAYEKHAYEPYYFKHYDVNINVREDNTLEVTEKIDAYFNEERHGIYRTIPTLNTVTRADGTVTRIRAKIENIDVSESYSADRDLEFCSVRIGDENTLVTGDHSYTISYQYVLGEDKNEGFDELYYNIIGNQWDTYIDEVSFTITMPKEFDSSLVGFSTGAYGTVGTGSVEYTVDGNVIIGKTTEGLSPYSALTVRTELPDGYFYFNKALHYTKLTMLAVMPLIAFAVVMVLWAKFGRDKKVVKVVEFYPPENMSSADVAYWYNGAIDNKNLVPLLIELANEGYIEINEINGRLRKSEFEIKKLKQTYDGPDNNKRLFFNGLFKCSGRDVVYEDDLQEEFYVTLGEISKAYNSMENRTKVFNKKSLFMRIAGWLISVLSVLLTLFLSAIMLGGIEKYIFTAVGVIIGIFSFVFSFFIRQRTDEGHLILQKIEGFRLFLETAEKERLEALVEDNPKYFYNILPYTYVLGVSDKWISKFEGIAIEPADWYTSSHPFNSIMFYHFINRTIQSSTRAMTSMPESQSSGGGFSGGGGFAGGGVGGGGGGSW